MVSDRAGARVMRVDPPVLELRRGQALEERANGPRRAERVVGEAVEREGSIEPREPRRRVGMRADQVVGVQTPPGPLFGDAPHDAHPGITIELECTTRVVSLARREADVALRLSRPREENVVTRRLASVPLSLYASRAYVERSGTPSDPDVSLAGHPVVLFADSRAFAVENEWFAPRLGGARVVLRSDSEIVVPVTG